MLLAQGLAVSLLAVETERPLKFGRLCARLRGLLHAAQRLVGCEFVAHVRTALPLVIFVESALCI